MKDTILWVGIAVLVVVVLGYFGLGGGGRDADAHRLVEEGAILLDVRTPEEFASGHPEGAVNIPVQELERRMTEVGAEDKAVVVYCRSGSRSSAAAAMLRKAGYAKVHDMRSMSRW